MNDELYYIDDYGNNYYFIKTVMGNYVAWVTNKNKDPILKWFIKIKK